MNGSNHPARSDDVLRYFVEHLDGRLGRTSLVKLAYLTDYEARRHLGYPLTGFAWTRDNHGPFCAAYYESIQRLESDGALSEERQVFPNGKFGYRYYAGEVAIPTPFSRAEEAILSHVLKAYGHAPLDQILDVAYETEPMKKEPEHGDLLDMASLDHAGTRELGGISLERVIGSEQDFAAGEFVTQEQLERELRDSLGADRR